MKDYEDKDDDLSYAMASSAIRDEQQRMKALPEEERALERMKTSARYEAEEARRAAIRCGDYGDKELNKLVSEAWERWATGSKSVQRLQEELVKALVEVARSKGLRLRQDEESARRYLTRLNPVPGNVQAILDKIKEEEKRVHFFERERIRACINAEENLFKKVYEAALEDRKKRHLEHNAFSDKVVGRNF